MNSEKSKRAQIVTKSGIYAVAFIFLVSAVTANAAFEDVELGARPLAMVSAFVAAADGAGAIFWNSAGLVRVSDRELTMSYLELYDLVSYSSLGYAQPVKMGSMGFGFVSSSDIDGVYREIVITLSAMRVEPE